MLLLNLSVVGYTKTGRLEREREVQSAVVVLANRHGDSRPTQCWATVMSLTVHWRLLDNRSPLWEHYLWSWRWSWDNSIRSAVAVLVSALSIQKTVDFCDHAAQSLAHVFETAAQSLHVNRVDAGV